MTQIKFVKEIPIINGTYKKDTPNSEIGFQKWLVTKTHEVIMEYEIVAKTKKEAEDLLERKERIKSKMERLTNQLKAQHSLEVDQKYYKE